MPFARHKLLAPAMFLPVVVFELLSGFFIYLKSYLPKKLPGFPESFCMFIAIHIIPGSSALSKYKYEGNNMDYKYSHFFILKYATNVFKILITKTKSALYLHFSYLIFGATAISSLIFVLNISVLPDSTSFFLPLRKIMTFPSGQGFISLHSEPL
jgi:hypothetical protein